MGSKNQSLLSVISVFLSVVAIFFSYKTWDEAHSANEISVQALEESRNASSLADEANRISNEANNKSDEANKISILSLEEMRKGTRISNKQIEMLSKSIESDKMWSIVWSTSTDEYFEQEIDVRIKVELSLRNMSKNTSSMSAKIKTEGFCVYEDDLNNCSSELYLSGSAVGANEYYKNSFFIHTFESRPEFASVEVYVYNSEEELNQIRIFNYAKDENGKYYVIPEDYE